MEAGPCFHLLLVVAGRASVGSAWRVDHHQGVQRGQQAEPQALHLDLWKDMSFDLLASYPHQIFQSPHFSMLVHILPVHFYQLAV